MTQSRSKTANIHGAPMAICVKRCTLSISSTSTAFSRASARTIWHLWRIPGQRLWTTPDLWLSRLKKDRDSFLLHAKRGVAMLVHFVCEDARTPCAVPAGTFCDMCGAMGSGHALGQARGRVEIPSKIRELVLSIDNAKGATDKPVASIRRNIRATTRDLDFAPTFYCEKPSTAQYLESYSPTSDDCTPTFHLGKRSTTRNLSEEIWSATKCSY